MTKRYRGRDTENSKGLNININSSDKEIVKNKARKHGFTLSAYVRLVLQHAEIKNVDKKYYEPQNYDKNKPRINVKLSQDEHQIIQEKANSLNLDKSSYAKLALLETEINIKVEQVVS